MTADYLGFPTSLYGKIKQKRKWMPPVEGIRLASGTEETISETLEPLSIEKIRNL